jgi:hypothetical protein
MSSVQEINKLLGIESSNKKLLSISQSLIKNYWDYKAGKYCGEAFMRLDINHEAEKASSERMKVGQYFEWLCTGQVLRDGSVPPEPLTKTGKPTADGERMKNQASRFMALKEAEKLEIIETGKVIEYEAGNFKLKGILDIFGEMYGRPAIVDLKTSGLIGNQWEEYGWNTSTFNMRDKLTIQPVFYKYLADVTLGIRDIPFYYSIHSSSNDTDSEFWEVQLSDYDKAMNLFESMINQYAEEILFQKETGFAPFPDVKRCKECPLFESCVFKKLTPTRKLVVIDGIYKK